MKRKKGQHQGGEKIQSESSSDEEDMEKLRQAVDHTFFTDKLYSQTKPNGSTQEEETAKELPKSLRHLPEEQLQVDVKVTSEMRRHVGKKVAHIINNMVEYVDMSVKLKLKSKKHKGGVKLFTNSKDFLTTEAPVEVTLSREERKKIKRRNISGDEEMHQNIEDVVVAPEYVLSGESTKHWKRRRKEKLERYKEGSNGDLVPLI